MCSRGTACATVLSACRVFVACPRPHINCPSVSPGDPEPLGEWALARLTPTHQGRHAQERRRFCTAFRRPSREQLCLRNRFLGRTVTQLRSRCASEAFGWMPHRPPASTPVGERGVPSGRAFLKTVLGNGEGAINPRGTLCQRSPRRGLHQSHAVRARPSVSVGRRIGEFVCICACSRRSSTG